MPEANAPQPDGKAAFLAAADALAGAALHEQSRPACDLRERLHLAVLAGARAEVPVRTSAAIAAASWMPAAEHPFPVEA